MKGIRSNVVDGLKKYVQVEIKDQGFHGLSENEKKALGLIVSAAKLLDKVYKNQVWHENEKTMKKVEDQKDEELLRFYKINYGPWDRLDEEAKPFIEGIPAKPKGANFYPEDLTKEEFEKWVEGLSAEEKEKAVGFFYVIRRNEKGKLTSIPYSEEYQQFLKPASEFLKEASTLVENPSLAKFLALRAESFLQNDYYESDLAWLDVTEDSKLEITIGPYEVYEDALFNYKASFEAFVTIRDFESTAQLKNFRNWMQELEDNLPIPEELKNKELSVPPIVVVNEIFVGGDHAGPQTAAFNLPNDERVLEKGCKMVILKNVQEAKFENILKSISQIVLREDQQQYVSFYTFFTSILLHEMSHSLGPHNIKRQPALADGESEGNLINSTVRKELQEVHSAIEEAKADIVGMYHVKYLSEKEARLDPALKKHFYVTYLASAFRSIRFGLEEAHGKGQALQLNYLIDEGGLEYDEKTERFGVNFGKIEEAIKKLTAKILLIQEKGDKQKAKELLDKYGINREYTKKALEKLSGVPVDIFPIYSLFEK